MVSYGATYGQPNIQQLLQTYGYQYQNAGGDINRVGKLAAEASLKASGVTTSSSDRDQSCCNTDTDDDG